MLRFTILASLLFVQAAAIRILTNPDIIMIMGADRDENGCIGSAGYKWCNYTETCESVNHICAPFKK